MIAEPYINQKTGEIRTFCPCCKHFELETGLWKLYTDFEREKLGMLWTQWLRLDDRFGYVIRCQKRDEKPFAPDAIGLGEYSSIHEIGYSTFDHHADSESSRLLKRAEFLKAVCEKE